MTCDEFSGLFWAHYISLEKEFIQTLQYVSLSSDNYSTYSEMYLKLLLEIGSEVDVSLKQYCVSLDPTFTGGTISDYRSCLTTHKPSFFIEEVAVHEDVLLLKPWDNRDANGDFISPFWWTAYNKCKHNRTETGTIANLTKEYYKFANMEHVINGLAGLYQVLLYNYRILAMAENKKIEIPLPGSRLFALKGSDWSTVSFFQDFAQYFDNGVLVTVTSTIHY